jgi:hypothetical protein
MRRHPTLYVREMLYCLALVAMLPLLGACSSANGASSDRDPQRWSWLGENGGTYWYVPAENLPAFFWQTDDPAAAQPIGDQTVWHIERYENGYIFGSVAAQFSGFPVQCQYLIGSVTPTGQVYLTFNPLQATSDDTPMLTTGFGNMVRADGQWTFSMQMASGSSSAQVTHWAYMLQCTSDQPCWTDLPGQAGSIEAMLAACGAS